MSTVTTLSELFYHVKTLLGNREMNLMARTKWAYRKKDTEKLITRLQNNKSSLMLMLLILQW